MSGKYRKAVFSILRMLLRNEDIQYVVYCIYVLNWVRGFLLTAAAGM